MKRILIFSSMALFALGGCSGLMYAQKEIKAVENIQPLAKGIYFIVNERGLALTPYQPSPGSNVFARSLNRSGIQKWEVSPRSGGSYTIKLVESNMFFQPHDVAERTAVLDITLNGALFNIQADKSSSTSWNIKSRKFRNDAMCSYVFSPELPTEVRFLPLEASKEFKWKFIAVE